MFFPPRILWQCCLTYKGHFSPSVWLLIQTKYLQSTLAGLPAVGAFLMCFSFVFLLCILEAAYSKGWHMKHEPSSGQDGGIGRHTSPPCTIMRKITNDLKTKNTQNFQKIKLWKSDNQGFKEAIQKGKNG